MTKKQAVALNSRFLSMDSTIKVYDEAYKYKYYQYHQASKALARQDSIIADLNRQLLIKPTFKAMTKTDILMSFLISAFGVFIVVSP
jgi:hypothetical protein